MNASSQEATFNWIALGTGNLLSRCCHKNLVTGKRRSFKGGALVSKSDSVIGKLVQTISSNTFPLLLRDLSLSNVKFASAK